jgi:hypothetical protein
MDAEGLVEELGSFTDDTGHAHDDYGGQRAAGLVKIG